MCYFNKQSSRTEPKQEYLFNPSLELLHRNIDPLRFIQSVLQSIFAISNSIRGTVEKNQDREQILKGGAITTKPFVSDIFSIYPCPRFRILTVFAKVAQANL